MATELAFVSTFLHQPSPATLKSVLEDVRQSARLASHSLSLTLARSLARTLSPRRAARRKEKKNALICVSLAVAELGVSVNINKTFHKC